MLLRILKRRSIERNALRPMSVASEWGLFSEFLTTWLYDITHKLTQRVRGRENEKKTT